MASSMAKRITDLTPRQREVVRLISLGCSCPEVAEILDISPLTAGNHRTAAMKILGVDKATILTRIALKHRISSLTDKLTAAEKRKSGRKRDGWN